MNLREAIEAVIGGSDPKVVFQGLQEEGPLRARRGGAPSYAAARVARSRFFRHRETYRRAHKQWQSSAEGKAFYRKLARFNARNQGLTSAPTLRPSTSVQGTFFAALPRGPREALELAEGLTLALPARGALGQLAGLLEASKGLPAQELTELLHLLLE